MHRSQTTTYPSTKTLIKSDEFRLWPFRACALRLGYSLAPTFIRREYPPASGGKCCRSFYCLYCFGRLQRVVAEAGALPTQMKTKSWRPIGRDSTLQQYICIIR